MFDYMIILINVINIYRRKSFYSKYIISLFYPYPGHQLDV